MRIESTIAGTDFIVFPYLVEYVTRDHPGQSVFDTRSVFDVRGEYVGDDGGVRDIFDIETWLYGRTRDDGFPAEYQRKMYAS